MNDPPQGKCGLGNHISPVFPCYLCPDKEKKKRKEKEKEKEKKKPLDFTIGLRKYIVISHHT
jgi:hypothetical protein